MAPSNKISQKTTIKNDRGLFFCSSSSFQECVEYSLLNDKKKLKMFGPRTWCTNTFWLWSYVTLKLWSCELYSPLTSVNLGNTFFKYLKCIQSNQTSKSTSQSDLETLNLKQINFKKFIKRLDGFKKKASVKNSYYQFSNNSTIQLT